VARTTSSIGAVHCVCSSNHFDFDSHFGGMAFNILSNNTLNKKKLHYKERK